jgi:hypothetical protein
MEIPVCRYRICAAWIGEALTFVVMILCVVGFLFDLCEAESGGDKRIPPVVSEGKQPASTNHNARIVPPKPSNAVAWQDYVKKGWDSPFGLDYVFILNKRYWDPGISHDLGGVVGVRWVNFARIEWGLIEPKPPRNGIHTYDWSVLDKGVRQWQQFGVHIMMSLNMNSRWGTAPRRDDVYTCTPWYVKWYLKKNLSDYLPKPEHMGSFRAYIRQLVERYDGDGKDDMPGLLQPILHYQIGNEYCNEIFWGGTAQDYCVLLKESATSARKANKNVKIILSGIHFEEFYGFYEKEIRPQTKAYVEKNFARIKKNSCMREAFTRAADFSLESMRCCDYYDIVDVRLGEYGRIDECKRQLKAIGCPDKDIWSAEVYSAIPLLGTSVAGSIRSYPAPSNSRLYRTVLSRPKHKNFKTFSEWFRAMQAGHLVKEFMAALHGGSKKIMMGWATDVQEGRAMMGTMMSCTGLKSLTLNKLWPAAYTYKLLIQKLDGIKSCKRLTMPKNTYVYECRVKGNRRVLVAFYDDHVGQNHDEPLGSGQLSLPLSGKYARVTHIITKIDQTDPIVERIETKRGKLNIPISEYPVFIEPL